MKITELINQLSKYDGNLKVKHSTNYFFRFTKVSVSKRNLDKKRIGPYQDDYDSGDIIALKSLYELRMYNRRYTASKLIKTLEYYKEVYGDKEIVLCYDDTYCSPNIFLYVDHNGELNLI